MPSSEQLPNLTEDLYRIHQELLAIAVQHKDDGQALLKILRQVELTHREISENYFYPSLPDRRRDLYNILRDMEAEGGWPYIVRPKLKFIIDNFLKTEGFDSPDKKEETP